MESRAAIKIAGVEILSDSLLDNENHKSKLLRTSLVGTNPSKVLARETLSYIVTIIQSPPLVENPLLSAYSVLYSIITSCRRIDSKKKKKKKTSCSKHVSFRYIQFFIATYSLYQIMYKYCSYLLDRPIRSTHIHISYSERILNLLKFTARNLCYVEAFLIGCIAETLPIYTV